MATVVPRITRFAANWDIGIKLFDILSNLLDPWTISIPKEAALRINGLYFAHKNQSISAKKTETTGKFLLQFRDLVFKIASQLPHDGSQQQILVNFVAALRDIRTSDEYEGRKLWEGLPIMGICGVDALNDVEYNTPEEMNFKTFIALLTKDNILNCSRFALIEFRNTLESIPDHRSRAYQEQGPEIDRRMPYALMWLSLAGEKLFLYAVQGGIGDVDGGNLWKGGRKGFCVERWRLWKRRFGEISRFDQVSEETRRLAKEAEERMGMIEGAVMVG